LCSKTVVLVLYWGWGTLAVVVLTGLQLFLDLLGFLFLDTDWTLWAAHSTVT